MEQWKDITDFEGLYQVSNLGNIKSIARVSTIGRRLKERMLSLKVNKDNGYVYVSLFRQGKTYNKRVHILVAQEWVKNPNKLPIVHHKDADKENNKVNNLQWATQKTNVNESIKAGNMKVTGSEHPQAKLTEESVYEIKELLATTKLTQKSIAERYGVEKSAISKIKRNITWTHVEYPRRKL